MLAGDYFSFFAKSKQVPGSSHCRLCQDPVEDLVHILCHCPAYTDSRQRILEELSTLLCVDNNDKSSKILDRETVQHLLSAKRTLTQFILDCCSFNLPTSLRYNDNDPKVRKIFSLARDLCYTIHTTRINRLREIKNPATKA